MAEQSTAREIRARSTALTPTSADRFIASLGGDARAAVIQLLVLVDSLQLENEALTTGASRGYPRAAVR
jgi:hypothetical protein